MRYIPIEIFFQKIKFKNKKSYDRKAIAHKKKPSKESLYGKNP